MHTSMHTKIHTYVHACMHTCLLIQIDVVFMHMGMHFVILDKRSTIKSVATINIF